MILTQSTSVRISLLSRSSVVMEATQWNNSTIQLFVLLDFKQKKIELLLKLFFQRTSSGQAVTGLRPAPPREAGPSTHNTVLHKNSFLLQKT